MRNKLMILTVIAVFIAFGLSTGCKKKFDITGTWTLSWVWSNNAKAPAGAVTSAMSSAGPNTMLITFSGDLKSGTFKDGYGDSGTYSVNGDSVNWVYPVGTTFIGSATDSKNMNGTFITAYGASGTWTATR